MKSEDKEIHTFMFCSLLVAKTCVFFKIVFGHIYAPNQFEFSVEHLSKFQYALYKTQQKTYIFLQFQLSTLYIHKDPIFVKDPIITWEQYSAWDYREVWNNAVELN